jgi:hypothetical protein
MAFLQLQPSNLPSVGLSFPGFWFSSADAA